MCGRYDLHTLLDELQQYFGLSDEIDFTPHYNVAPSYRMPIVREDTTGRHLALAQWGFVPHWAKGAANVKPINARAETLADKPTFRDSLRNRRCLIPANGFYEWTREGRRKQPHYLKLDDSELLAFAGLWDRRAGPDGPLDTFAIITTGANDTMRAVHDRMPVILDRAAHDDWLIRGRTDLLAPYGRGMTCHPVSTRVNAPANDSPDLILAAGER